MNRAFVLLILLAGIYFAAFGFASQKYENHLDRFENRLNLLVTQLGTSARNETFPALVAHQSYKLPVEPSFWNPLRTFSTLVLDANPINEGMETFVKDVADSTNYMNRLSRLRDQLENHSTFSKVKQIADTIVRFKADLDCVTKEVNMQDSGPAEVECTGIDLKRAHLEGANLRRADLRGADLFGAP